MPDGLLAVIVTEASVASSCAAGLPVMVAVPSPLSWKANVGGRTSDSLNAGGGSPVVVTVKVNGLPVTAIAELALVNAGTVGCQRTGRWTGSSSRRYLSLSRTGGTDRHRCRSGQDPRSSPCRRRCP